MFKFFIILNAAKENFKFTINLYTNPPIKPKAERDFKLELLSAVIIKFNRNNIKGDIRYIILYIGFPAGEPRGYSKKIFKFRIKPYTTNIPFKDFIFGTG